MQGFMGRRNESLRFSSSSFPSSPSMSASFTQSLALVSRLLRGQKRLVKLTGINAVCQMKEHLTSHDFKFILSTDSVSALIMCDWLVMNGSDSAALDLVTKVYQACCDTEGLNKLTSLSKERQASVKETFLKSSLPQTQVSINSSVNLQSNTEAITELMDSNETYDVVDISVLEDEPASLVTLPVRETCPVCGAGIVVESLNYGTCLNAHRWPRCCVSFTVCTELAQRRCQDCNSCVSTPSLGSSRWLCGLLQLTSKCPFCFGFFH